MTKEFEIARLLMLQAARSKQISESQGFAWAQRMWPLRISPIEQAFQADFDITDRQVEATSSEIDKAWRSGTPIDYYTLEQRHGPSTVTGLDRMQVVAICRMFFLDGRFDQTVWHALTVPGSGPIESQGLADPFKPNDDLHI